MAVSHLFGCGETALLWPWNNSRKPKTDFTGKVPKIHRSIFRAESASFTPAAPGLEERPQKRETKPKKT